MPTAQAPIELDVVKPEQSETKKYIPKTTDGVFSNIAAKPEIIKIESDTSKNDLPPTYEEAASTMPPSYQDALDSNFDDISEIIIDDMEVGNGGIFLIHCFISVMFQIVGVILSFILARSHAGKYGTIAGLGITLLMYSFTIEDATGIDKRLRPLISTILFIGGYGIFMMSLYLYQNIVSLAREMHSNHNNNI